MYYDRNIFMARVERFIMNYTLFVEGRGEPVGEFMEFNDAWKYVQKIRTAPLTPGKNSYVVSIKNNITQKTLLVQSRFTKEQIKELIG